MATNWTRQTRELSRQCDDPKSDLYSEQGRLGKKRLAQIYESAASVSEIKRHAKRRDTAEFSFDGSHI